MANMAIVTALASRSSAVFADRLNHASLNDAVLLSRAEFRRYAHGDVAMLERLLAASDAATKLIVTDAVFSMDGDIAPVRELLALAERHDAWLVLDDAHGFGVLGARGRGVLELFEVRSPRLVYMATLGKAAGVSGAFVAGARDVIETLVQRARTYIYTTAAPPLLAHAVSKSLELIERDGWRRKRLAEHIGADNHTPGRTSAGNCCLRKRRYSRSSSVRAALRWRFPKNWRSAACSCRRSGRPRCRGAPRDCASRFRRITRRTMSPCWPTLWLMSNERRDEDARAPTRLGHHRRRVRGADRIAERACRRDCASTCRATAG